MGGPSQLSSRTKRFDWQKLIGQEVQATQVFFATDQASLTLDDDLALRDLVKSLTPVLLKHGIDISLRCEGWADPRQSLSYNLALSNQRCDTVIAFLRRELQGAVRSATSGISGAGHGERATSVQLERYAEERRVDVFVKVTRKPIAAPQARTAARKSRGPTPWSQRRVHLFKTYSPDYQRWSRLGLDHLISEYEQNEEDGEPVPMIRPEDIPKVMALIEQVASPEDVARIKQWARSRPAAKVLADAFCVEYRRAYDDAYRRSPGTLIK
jgi:hypothetical protein